jgi:hypothetical protein
LAKLVSGIPNTLTISYLSRQSHHKQSGNARFRARFQDIETIK